MTPLKQVATNLVEWLVVTDELASSFKVSHDSGGAAPAPPTTNEYLTNVVEAHCHVAGSTSRERLMSNLHGI